MFLDYVSGVGSSRQFAIGGQRRDAAAAALPLPFNSYAAGCFSDFVFVPAMSLTTMSSHDCLILIDFGWSLSGEAALAANCIRARNGFGEGCARSRLDYCSPNTVFCVACFCPGQYQERRK